MSTMSRLSVAFAGLFTLASSIAAQDALSAARELYESASYAEALSALNQVQPTADVIEVEKYRALCLLALGRSKEAEQSLEKLAINRPLFTFDGSDDPPRLVALYSDVRRRTLPDATKQLYLRAKTAFDKGEMADARRQFKEIVTLAETAPQEHAAMMADLKILAAGFVTLTELASKKEVVPTDTTVSTPDNGQPRQAVSPVADSKPANPAVSDTIYDVRNTGVRAPVAISRSVPIWTRPAPLRRLPYAGVLDVVVDEGGSVIEAKMATPIHVTYDPILIAAARRWRYQPATMDGKPVKFRLSYAIAAEEGK